jgi:pyruvate dehydrogenase E2 component (dihydrolipoamide acetyltransferase)
MAELLRMPEVAANTTEAVLLSWPVPAGTPYSEGDTVAVVETAKAVVEVEAQADGVIHRTLVDEGAEVAVGEPIALIGTRGERVEDVEATLAELGASASATSATSDPIDAKSDVALDVPEADPVPSTPAPDQPGKGNGTRIFASPLARRLARDAGIPVTEISGTGPHRRIVRRDVEVAIAQRERHDAPLPAASADAGVTTRPHTRARRAVAARLTESKQTTPHFYLRASVRVDRLLQLREELNEGSAVRISVNDLIIKAVARAHTEVPAMNVTWGAEVVRSFSTVDLAVAVATVTSLVTPVLRSVELMSITTVARTTQDFVERAKHGRLHQHELEGGSATVTNLGMYGTEEFAAIINPPHASILAVGAARQEPVVADGRLEVGTVIRLTLSVDHRPVDGTIAAQWMRVLVAAIEHPARILA